MRTDPQHAERFMPSEQDQIPVIWSKMGDEIVVVTTSDRPLKKWTRLLNPELGDVLAQFLGSHGAAETVQVRTFKMRDADLKFWDSAVRKGTDGYSYGVVWGDDAKFLKNLQFKELPPANGVLRAPPIDPAAIAVAAALHQVQQTLARMQDQLDQVQATVEWLEARRQSKQAAELLTAASSLRSVGRRCLVAGTVQPEDLLRIAHLEQVVGTVHREICMEMHDIAKVLAFHDVKQAKKARDLDAARIGDLVVLDAFALNALKTWHQLLLLSKAASGRLALGEEDEARQELIELASATVASVKALKKVNTRMADRSLLEYMLSVGIPKGRSQDAALRKAAEGNRELAKKRASQAKKEISAFVDSLSQLSVVEVGRRNPLHLVSGANPPTQA